MQEDSFSVGTPVSRTHFATKQDFSTISFDFYHKKDLDHAWLLITSKTPRSIFGGAYLTALEELRKEKKQFETDLKADLETINKYPTIFRNPTLTRPSKAKLKAYLDVDFDNLKEAIDTKHRQLEQTMVSDLRRCIGFYKKEKQITENKKPPIAAIRAKAMTNPNGSERQKYVNQKVAEWNADNKARIANCVETIKTIEAERENILATIKHMKKITELFKERIDKFVAKHPKTKTITRYDLQIKDKTNGRYHNKTSTAATLRIH